MFRYRSELYIVANSGDILQFLQGHPLHHIRHRLDVVQATQPCPEWCHTCWQDIYLPVYIIRFLLDRYGGDALLLKLDNGMTLSKLSEYEELLETNANRVTECSTDAYEGLLDRIEITHANLGAEVEMFVYPTYDRQQPYTDAVLYAICVKDYKEADYHGMAEKLAEYLGRYYEVSRYAT